MDMMITGISLTVGSALSSRSTCQPSFSGIMMSSVMANGWRMRASSIPRSPLSAPTTRKRAGASESRRSAITSGSSSIARTTGSSFMRSGVISSTATAIVSVSGRMGSVIVNVVPRPGALSTSIVPPR